MGFFIKRLEENDAEKNLSHLFALPVRLVDNKMTMDRKKYLEGMFPKVIRESKLMDIKIPLTL